MTRPARTHPKLTDPDRNRVLHSPRTRLETAQNHRAELEDRRALRSLERLDIATRLDELPDRQLLHLPEPARSTVPIQTTAVLTAAQAAAVAAAGATWANAVIIAAVVTGCGAVAGATANLTIVHADHPPNPPVWAKALPPLSGVCVAAGATVSGVTAGIAAGLLGVLVAGVIAWLCCGRLNRAHGMRVELEARARALDEELRTIDNTVVNCDAQIREATSTLAARYNDLDHTPSRPVV